MFPFSSGAAQQYPKTSDDSAEQLANSFAGKIGHLIEPVIEPLGYDWKIGIGVVASFAAREVFVSAMAITYHVEEDDDETVTRQQLREKFLAGETAGRFTGLYAPHLHEPARLLRFRASMRQHHRHRETGNQHLALADFSIRLHDGDRVLSGIDRLPGRKGPGI